MMTAENLSELIDEAARLGAKLAEAIAQAGGHVALGVLVSRDGISVWVHHVPRAAFEALGAGMTVDRGRVAAGRSGLYDVAQVTRGPVTLWLFSEDYAATAIEAA